jgi:hypothetical protein
VPGIDKRLVAGAKFDLRDVEIDFDVRDNAGETAQMKAAAGGHIDWFRELTKISQANDALTQDRQGRTVLMHAVANNQLALLRQLADELQHVSFGLGSERRPLSYNKYFDAQAASLTDFSGRTALQLATELGHTEIADVIRSEMQQTIDALTAVLEQKGETEQKEVAQAFLELRSYAWRALGDAEKAAADLEQIPTLRSAPQSAQEAIEERPDHLFEE